MAVPSELTNMAYATDGVSVNFAFPIYFKAPGDLVVTVKDAAGIVTTKILSTHYTVSGTPASDGIYANGGSVAMNSAPAAGGTLRIVRRTPRLQLTVYQEGDNFPALAHERGIDTPVLIVQEALGAIGCLGIADGPPTSGTFKNGDWYKNANVLAGGSMGWMTTGGINPPWYEMPPISGVGA